MLSGTKRPNPAKCSHVETIVVRSAGVERIVCEECGQVSFSFHIDSHAAVERGMFARTVDRQREVAASGTF